MTHGLVTARKRQSMNQTNVENISCKYTNAFYESKLNPMVGLLIEGWPLYRVTWSGSEVREISHSIKTHL